MTWRSFTPREEPETDMSSETIYISNGTSRSVNIVVTSSDSGWEVEVWESKNGMHPVKRSGRDALVFEARNLAVAEAKTQAARATVALLMRQELEQ